MPVETNKALVAQIFRELSEGKHGALLSRIAADSHWTITGSCPVSGVFKSRQEFYEKTLSRITSQLSSRVRPIVRQIFGDGDTVILLWEGRSTARSGRPYDNQYCWVLKIHDGLIREGIIYNDTKLVCDLLGDTSAC